MSEDNTGARLDHDPAPHLNSALATSVAFPSSGLYDPSQGLAPTSAEISLGVVSNGLKVWATSHVPDSLACLPKPSGSGNSLIRLEQNQENQVKA